MSFQKKQSTILILLGFLICTIFFTIYILFFSTYTQIKNIYIYRENALVDIERAYSQVDYVRGKNLFSIDTKNISDRLIRGQSSLSNIRININFPSSVDIYLESHDVIFYTDSYLIFSNGSFESIASNMIKDDIIKVSLSEDIGEYISQRESLDPLVLGNIKSIITESRKNILGFSASDILYLIRENELIIRDPQNTLYIFDLERSIDMQVKKIAVYKKESPSLLAPTYIDIRIPNKLFICEQEESSTCRNNLTTIYGDPVIPFLP